MRRTPLRAKPPKRAEPIPHAVRQAIYERAGFTCEVRLEGRCETRAWGWYDLHHRLRQQHDGPHTEANLVVACSACHAFIHAHPEWAYARGLLIHRHDGPPSEPWVNVDASPREW